MTDLMETQYDQWFARLDKELKGQASERMHKVLMDGIQGQILPQTEEAIASESIKSIAALKTSELYSALSEDNEQSNESILSGLSRGVSSLVMNTSLQEDQKKSVLKNVDFQLIQCLVHIKSHESLRVYRDVASKELVIGLEANDSENSIHDDARLLSELVSFLESNDQVKQINIFIPLQDRFDLNLTRLTGFRRTLEHLSLAINRTLDVKIHAIYGAGKYTDPIEGKLIAASSQCLSAALSSADYFCVKFDQDYFSNPWPSKYIRALRSIPLLLEHESELLADRHILDGSHYMEALLSQYIQNVWSELQEKLKVPTVL